MKTDRYDKNKSKRSTLSVVGDTLLTYQNPSAPSHVDLRASGEVDFATRAAIGYIAPMKAIELEVLESVLRNGPVPGDHGGNAFRVGWIANPVIGHYRLSPVPFARQQDAAIGLRALLAAGVTTIEAFEQLDDEDARRIMCTSLQW